jgi:hypothetical protein
LRDLFGRKPTDLLEEQKKICKYIGKHQVNGFELMGIAQRRSNRFPCRREKTGLG